MVIVVFSPCHPDIFIHPLEMLVNNGVLIENARVKSVVCINVKKLHLSLQNNMYMFWLQLNFAIVLFVRLLAERYLWQMLHLSLLFQHL